MARTPQARTPQAAAEDDFYAQEDDFDEGTGALGQEGQDGGGETPEGSPVDTGEEQETGGEDPVEGDEDEFLDPDPAPRRASNRIQALANETRQLRAELEAERRARQPATPQQTGPREETEAEFEARLQLLDGSERADARMQRFIAQQQRRDAYNSVQAAANADRAAYADKSRTDPRMARWQDKVEEEFNKRLQMGQPVSRVDLFYWLVGKHLSENPKVTNQARKQAQQRVARNTVKPSQGGSDVRQQRRATSEQAARAKRLDGIQI